VPGRADPRAAARRVELARGDEQRGARAHGLLLVFATAEALETEARLCPALADLGVRCEPLSREELARREPALRDDLAGGAWFPDDAHLRPEKLVAALARLVRERGGVIEERCEVHGFEREAARVVAARTSRGPRSCAAVVLATGAWSPELGRALGLPLLVEPGRGYSITFERPDACPRIPLILEEAAVGVTPWRSGLRLSGTMEFSGFDRRPRPARLAALRAGARRFLRSSEGAQTVEEWFGWRAMTPDELPIIGRAQRLANVYVATGHGRMGVSMAPATAKLVAELLTGAEPHVDPRPYAPERFA